MSNSYLDFDLEIGKGKDGIYSVQARWQSNEAYAEAELPPAVDPLRLRQQIESVVLDAPLRRRRTFSDNEAIVKGFGQTLFDFALSGETLVQLRACQSRAKSQGLEGVRLRLRIFDPALAGLPWEYLYDSRLRDFLALDPTLVLVRYLHHAQSVAPLPVSTPLRILGMIAAPLNLQPLDVEGEKARIEQAIAPLQRAGKVELEWLAKDGALDLLAALRKGPWHIFHFIGHGDFDAQRDEGYLALCNPINKQAEPLYATHLARLLAAQRNHLRFVLLNACESGRSSSRDIFSSTAESLINRDIPAVLAMQYAITDNAATLFAQQLYQSLADGLPIDRSVAEARNALALADSQNLEWGVPVLHMRSPDGVLFEVEEKDKKTGREEDRKIEVPPLPQERDDGRSAASAPTEGGVWSAEASGEPKDAVRDMQPERSPASTYTRAAYGLGVVMLLVAGWLGWPYLQGIGSQTPTPTPSVAIAFASDTPFAVVNPITSTLPAPAATVTATSVPTQQATATETVAPTDTATLESTTTATERPTATDTLQPTATFTEVPTATATPKPTNTATPQPIATNTPRPTATPTDAGKPPINATIGTSWTEPTSGIEFVYVPAGEFLMGSSDTDKDADSDEKPQHRVQTGAYWIGKTEITNAQFQQFMDKHGYATESYWTTAGWQWRNDNKVTQPDCWTSSDFNGDKQPVVCVSWYEAMSYSEWLSQATGLTVRLPTEAEWEKAARGTDGRIYPWGNEEPTVDLANYGGKVGKTKEVGSYLGGASPYGALDMAGNVWEWNSSLYKAYPYDASDGREDLDAEGYRLLRGGSWPNDPYGVRGAVRLVYRREDRYFYVGFRVVLVVAPGS